MAFPSPSVNIADIDYPIKKKICDGLDDSGKWRDLAGVVEEKRFQLRSGEIEKFAQAFLKPPGFSNSPSEEFWHFCAGRGMKVAKLVQCLDKLNLEKEQMSLRKPEKLCIESWSQNMKVDNGTTCTLMCEAKGFPYPRYRWYKENDVDVMIEVADGDKKILEFKRARRCHDGYYVCQVYNRTTIDHNKQHKCLDGLLLQTEKIHLEVVGDDPEIVIKPTGYIPDIGAGSEDHSAPSSLKIIKQPSDTTVEELSPFSLECMAQGNPHPEYQWYRNGEKIPKALGGNKSLLMIEQSLVTRDNGDYYCYIYNGTELKTKTVKVNVFLPIPSFKTYEVIRLPTHQCVEENAPSKFQLILRTKKENIKGVWYFIRTDTTVEKISESRIISGRSRTSGDYVSTLNIKTTRHEHVGTYYCEICLDVDDIRLEPLERTRDVHLKILTENPSPIVKNPTAKIALFIGVSHFKSQNRLPSVQYDIRDTAKIFEALGFTVISLLDLTLSEILKAVDLVCDLIGPENYVTLYFVSHGCYLDGNHYLMPWDATHGPDLDNFLCIEKVFTSVQSRRPSFLFMIVDMCRTSGQPQFRSVGKAKDYKSEVHGNSLVIYSTSKYQQAFEPEFEPEKKGVFSQRFCEVLNSHKDKPVKELFNHLQDSFKEYMGSPIGKQFPMHPEMCDTLMDHKIKLTDPIDIEAYPDGAIDWEKKQQKYSFLNGYLHNPLEPVTISTIPGFLLRLSSEKQFSNSFVLIVEILDFGCISRVLDMELETTAKKDLEIVTESNKRTEWRFIVRNVQRLQSDFLPQLKIKYEYYADMSTNLPKPPTKTRTITSDIYSLRGMDKLRRPLISNSPVWLARTHSRDVSRIPQEDEEAPSSLDSNSQLID